MGSMTRRTMLKTAGTALVAGVLAPAANAWDSRPSNEKRRSQARHPKKIIIAGAGLAGLCCGYELMMRGHEVVLLEATGRSGGHVKTIHDPLADGLYADVGAEHFAEQGYDRYWSYVREFNLTPIRCNESENLIRFVKGKGYNAEAITDRKLLSEFGFNQKEIDFLAAGNWWDLKALYLAPYFDHVSDEYHPFAAGLNALDQITFSELSKKDGASPAAVERFGNAGSALNNVWHYAILKKRGVPAPPLAVYRLKGGNQVLPDTFAKKLGERVHLGAPVTAIECGETGVRVRFREFAKESAMEADYLVCCMNAHMLRQIAVSPAWPESKAYAIHNVGYDMYSRVVFQSRSPFWLKDKESVNWVWADPNLSQLWRTAEDVETTRAALVGTALNGASADDALAAFRKLYPGKSEDIEQAVIHSWGDDPWARACERVYSRPGELARLWPAVTEPAGRVHFAGAYTDNLRWGMEAACRSANRVAEEIGNA